MFNTLKRLFVYFLSASLFFLGFAQTVQAAMIGTSEAAAVSNAGQLRERVSSALERPDVQARLEQYGVKKSDAQARVAALSDDEVQALANRIDSLPAGGDVVGALVLIFVILLVTDILGLTKVFPFTRHR